MEKSRKKEVALLTDAELTEFSRDLTEKLSPNYDDEWRTELVSSLEELMQSQFSGEEVAELKYWWGGGDMPTTVSC